MSSRIQRIELDGMFAFTDSFREATKGCESCGPIAMVRSMSWGQKNGPIVKRKSFSKIALLVLLIAYFLHFLWI
jgi:hypothetical protein